MPIHKSALTRYLVLDRCFRNRYRKYFIEDLLKEVNHALVESAANGKGISMRQIRADIAFMRSPEGWEVELAELKEGRRMYYRYADPRFSINNSPLNQTEVEYLQAAFDILSQFTGMPQFEWLDDMIPKLNTGVEVNENRKSIMEYDTNVYLKGRDLLGILYGALVNRRVLRVLYQPFSANQPYEVTIHPHFLKQYNRRWYLFGYNPVEDRPDWNLAVDRIVSIREENESVIDTPIDWSEYFDDIVGVTHPSDGKVEEVVLVFNEKTGPYIESKPIHSSQRSKWVETNSLQVTLKVVLNYELEHTIIGYGEAVKVIAPLHLKERIASRLQLALAQY